MTKDEAHALLDAVRGGMNVPQRKLNQALVLTGDLTSRFVLGSVDRLDSTSELGGFDLLPTRLQ